MFRCDIRTSGDCEDPGDLLLNFAGAKWNEAPWDVGICLECLKHEWRESGRGLSLSLRRAAVALGQRRLHSFTTIAEKYIPS